MATQTVSRPRTRTPPAPGTRRNLGGGERTLRLVLGLVFLGLGYHAPSTGPKALCYVVAAWGLLTALFQFCPLNWLVGRDTYRGFSS